MDPTQSHLHATSSSHAPHYHIQWTRRECKKFEEVVSRIDPTSLTLFEQIQAEVPQKTVTQVVWRYMELEDYYRNKSRQPPRPKIESKEVIAISSDSDIDERPDCQNAIRKGKRVQIQGKRVKGDCVGAVIFSSELEKGDQALYQKEKANTGNSIPPDVAIEDSEDSQLIHTHMHGQRSPEAHLLKWEEITGWRAPVKPTSSETSPALPVTTSSGSPMAHYPPLPKALLGSSSTQPLSCRAEQERSGKHLDSENLSSDKNAQPRDQYFSSSSNVVPPNPGKLHNTVSSAQAASKTTNPDTELQRQPQRNSWPMFIKDEPQGPVSEVRMHPSMQQNSSRLGKRKVNDSSHNHMHTSSSSLPPVKKEPGSPLPNPQNSRRSFLAPSSSNCAPSSQRLSLVKVETQSPTQSHNCIPLSGPFAYNFGRPNPRASFRNMAPSSSRQSSLNIDPQCPSRSNGVNPMWMTPSSSTFLQNNGGDMRSRNNMAFPLVPKIKQEITEFLVPKGLPTNLHNRWLSRGIPILSSQNFMNVQRPLTNFYETGCVGGTQRNYPNPQLNPPLQPWSTTPCISNQPSLQIPFQWPINNPVFPQNSALGEGSSGRNGVGQINYQHQALAGTAQERFSWELQNGSEANPSLPNFMNID